MSTAADNSQTILDFIDDIRVPGDVFNDPTNEYWALVCLHQGMEFLYCQAYHLDQLVKERVNPEENRRYFASGNSQILSQVPQALLTCGFHWYAISACQYVKTIGAIARKLDPNRPLPHEYANTIIPEVIAFRDKVAAHFAWNTANNHDNDAERLASILPQLTFNHDSFYVGSLAVSLRRGERASRSKAIRPWSLCKVHESLRQRFWPSFESAEESGSARAKD